MADASQPDERSAADGGTRNPLAAADAGVPLGIPLEPLEPPAVRILSPSDGDEVSGLSRVILDFNKQGQSTLSVGVEGEGLMQLRGGQGDVYLASYQFADGPQTVVAELVTEEGEVLRDTVEVVFDNPDHELVSLQPGAVSFRNGEDVLLLAEFSEPDLELNADFSAIDTNFASSRVEIVNEGAGSFTIRYPLSESNTKPDGTYPVTVRSKNPAGEERVDELRLTLTNVNPSPLLVEGARYVEGPAPRFSADQAAPDILTTVEPATTLLRGGSTELTVAYEVDPDRPVDKVIVTVDGYSGYFLLPAAPSPNGVTEVRLTLKLPAMAPGFDNVGIGVGILDGLGQIVDWVSETIAVISIGGDGVQVSLTWNKDADLDLALTDPTGLLLDFENPTSGRGSLDLDSNALCQIDGTNAENISWQPGEEPQGTYQVRVALYDTCEEDLITWRVNATFCGHAETFTGTLTMADVDKSGVGQVVTEFTVDCNQVVRGSVIREKVNDVTKMGIRELGLVPFAPVRVVTASGDTTLAQGVTDSRGQYDLRFQNLDQGDYKVQVEASWVDPGSREVRGRVTPQGDEVAHRHESPEISGAEGLVRTENLRIKVEDGAGAFNVLHGIRAGYGWVDGKVSAARADGLPPMRGHWEEGGTTMINNSYQTGNDLFIEGTTSIPHQWSDSVIMHEFMHFVVRRLSFERLPGGGHSFTGKSAPKLMWSEGLATALGQDVLQDSLYADRRPAGANLYDIEALRADLTGTDPPRTRLGNHNEFMVSSVVWDVLDAANEAWDKFQERQFGFVAMFEHIPADRDGNGLDLTDFLDQLRADYPGNPDQDLKCITDKAGYPYDYPTGVVCPP